MSDNNMNDGIKKVVYTGIGLAAMSADAVGKAVNSLAARGEEAVQRGKIMNEELKRKRASAKANFKDIADALEKMTKDEIDSIRSKLSDIENTIERKSKDVKLNAEAITAQLVEMSQEELEAIKAKIEEIRMNWTDDGDKGAEF